MIQFNFKFSLLLLDNKRETVKISDWQLYCFSAKEGRSRFLLISLFLTFYDQQKRRRIPFFVFLSNKIFCFSLALILKFLFSLKLVLFSCCLPIIIMITDMNVVNQISLNLQETQPENEKFDTALDMF